MSEYDSLNHTKWECKYHFVSTVGIDERTIREYIRDQEKNDQKLDQQRLF